MHKNLWRDPNCKQFLIDVYYNENSMNQFKTSCLVQLDKLNNKLDIKPVNVPSVPELFQLSSKSANQDRLKADARVVDQNEPLLISCLHQIYSDNKQLHAYFDSIKNAYVVDNTKLIELEEVAFQHRSIMRDASR